MDGFYPNAPATYPENQTLNYPAHPPLQIGFVFDGGASGGGSNVATFSGQNSNPYPSAVMPMPSPNMHQYPPAPYYPHPQENMLQQSLPVPQLPHSSGNFGYPDNQSNYNYSNTRHLQVQDEVKHPPPEYHPNSDYNAYEQNGPNYGHGQGQKNGIPGGKLGVVGGAAVAGLGTALATNLLLPKKLKKNKLVKYGLPIAGAGAGGYYLNKLNNKPK